MSRYPILPLFYRPHGKGVNSALRALRCAAYRSTVIQHSRDGPHQKGDDQENSQPLVASFEEIIDQAAECGEQQEIKHGLFYAISFSRFSNIRTIAIVSRPQ